MYKILIVEDDYSISRALNENLEQRGFAVKALTKAERMDVIAAVKENQPHLIIMDVQLDYRDGYIWCHEIRKDSAVPIIFLTARSSDIDLITAMRLGGDDFISKPFNIDVLVAKMESVLRRTYSGGLSEQLVQSVLTVGRVELNIDKQQVCSGDRCTELSRNEFLVLMALMKSEGKLLARNTLIKALWQEESYINENALAVTISRVRSKLTQIGIEDFIVTKVGKGYGIL